MGNTSSSSSERGVKRVAAESATSSSFSACVLVALISLSDFENFSLFFQRTFYVPSFRVLVLFVKTGYKGKSASLLSRPNVVVFVVRWRSRVNGTFVRFDDDEEDENDDSFFFFFFFFFSICIVA